MCFLVKVCYKFNLSHDTYSCDKNMYLYVKININEILLLYKVKLSQLNYFHWLKNTI